MGKCKKTKNCVCSTMNVGERFNHFSSTFQDLAKANPKRRRSILRRAPPCFTRLLCETSLNILKGNLSLPVSHYEHLRPHKRLLLNLCKPAVSLKQKKDILVKKRGGAAFLAALAPIALSALSSFLGTTLGKVIS